MHLGRARAGAAWRHLPSSLATRHCVPMYAPPTTHGDGWDHGGSRKVGVGSQYAMVALTSVFLGTVSMKPPRDVAWHSACTENGGVYKLVSAFPTGTRLSLLSTATKQRVLHHVPGAPRTLPQQGPVLASRHRRQPRRQGTRSTHQDRHRALPDLMLLLFLQRAHRWVPAVEIRSADLSRHPSDDEAASKDQNSSSHRQPPHHPPRRAHLPLAHRRRVYRPPPRAHPHRRRRRHGHARCKRRAAIQA